MENGDKVIITAKGPLGVLDPDSHRRAFHPTIVLHQGDVATYISGDPEMVGVEDWHLVEVERDGHLYLAPVGADMFGWLCQNCEEAEGRFSVAEDEDDDDSEYVHLCRDCVARH